MKIHRHFPGFFFLGIAILITGCCGCGKGIPAPAAPGIRFEQACKIASKDSFLKPHVYNASGFNLFAYQTPLGTARSKPVHIYIEGDGLAWLTSTTISDNPTPLNPVGLKLAAQDPFPFKVYLARPCQYLTSPKCRKEYWTDHRFSAEIINYYNAVLDQIKDEYGPVSFVLFGYSGGGTVAALLSARRDDISALVTVAGNLDTNFWTKKHSLSPLSGSLNPADFTSALENIQQYHFIGRKDKVIDKSVFLSYQNHFTNKENLRYKVFPSFTHSCCWEAEWKSILKSIVTR